MNYLWTDDGARAEAIFDGIGDAMSAALASDPPADLSHIMVSARPHGGLGWRVAGVRRGPPLTPVFLASPAA